MCSRLFTLEMAITCTGTCTALAGIEWTGANVRKREANYRRRKTIKAIQIKKGEIVILARILTRVSSTIITTTLSSTVTHPE